MQLDNCYVFFKAKKECTAIVATIIDPPKIVSKLGCSLITSQTHNGPNMVSSKKKMLTSAAVMYLGARVTRTKGIATHMMHIRGIIIRSFSFNANLSAKNKAINLGGNRNVKDAKFEDITSATIKREKAMEAARKSVKSKVKGKKKIINSTKTTSTKGKVNRVKLSTSERTAFLAQMKPKVKKRIQKMKGSTKDHAIIKWAVSKGLV